MPRRPCGRHLPPLSGLKRMVSLADFSPSSRSQFSATRVRCAIWACLGVVVADIAVIIPHGTAARL